MRAAKSTGRDAALEATLDALQQQALKGRGRWQHGRWEGCRLSMRLDDAMQADYAMTAPTAMEADTFAALVDAVLAWLNANRYGVWTAKLMAGDRVRTAHLTCVTHHVVRSRA